MALTKYQKLLLDNLEEDEQWWISDMSGREQRTMDLMRDRGYCTKMELANGYHYRLTDKGLDAVAKIRGVMMV